MTVKIVKLQELLLLLYTYWISRENAVMEIVLEYL